MNTIIFSLKPQYWQRVLGGIKHYEYRRSFYNEPVKAFVYVTKPVGAIEGWIQFGAPIINTPEHIASIAESESPGSYNGMLDYFKGKDQAYATPIESFGRLQNPISLNELQERFNFTAPQNYQIVKLDSELGNVLKEE